MMKVRPSGRPPYWYPVNLAYLLSFLAELRSHERLCALFALEKPLQLSGQDIGASAELTGSQEVFPSRALLYLQDSGA